MKRVILCSIIAISLSQIASAQTNNGSSNTSSSGSIQSSDKGQTTKSKKKGSKKVIKNNNRRNYKWENGQQATPTGNEATSINGGYSAIKPDTSKRRKQ